MRTLVGYLCSSLSSEHLVLRRACMGCLRQLAQRHPHILAGSSLLRRGHPLFYVFKERALPQFLNKRCIKLAMFHCSTTTNLKRLHIVLIPQASCINIQFFESQGQNTSTYNSCWSIHPFLEKSPPTNVKLLLPHSRWFGKGRLSCLWSELIPQFIKWKMTGI